MLGRIAAAAAIIALAGCAGMESAGRNAARAPEPARVASAPPPAAAAPTPAPTVASPPPQTAPTNPAPTLASPPPQAMPTTPAPPATASAPPPAATAQADRAVITASHEDDDDSTVVVPGVRERQVQPPNGDPRSNAERMQDIRAWDQCVMRVQGAAEANPMRPQLDTPEDYCSQSLGMASRMAIPASRLERR